jgi:hypothetical protein
VHPIGIAAAIVAALIHVWFFALESLWFPILTVGLSF